MPLEFLNVARLKGAFKKIMTTKYAFIPSVVESMLSWVFRMATTIFQLIFPASVVGKTDARRISYLRSKLESSATYEEFRSICLKLDELEGKTEWKENPASPLYDYKLVEQHFKNMMDCSHSKTDIHRLVFRLRADLLRNLGNLGNKELYGYTRIGTKKLIEEYTVSVTKQLEYICDTDFEDVSFSFQDKFDFFYETRRAYGRTALMLSGGAGFGMYHFGVLKALSQQGLLPRIISGSSVGAIVASIVAVKTDEELPEIFHPESLNLEVFDSPQNSSQLMRKIKRLLTQGVLMDIEKFQTALRANFGDLTFQDAYDRTGRILNITVVPAGNAEVPRLLNYLTAPHVLIWSAACASCALPGLFAPVSLMAKTVDGQIVPYHPPDVKWSDGSLALDLPLQRLAELFNVNQVIVSQVNPHVIPFLSSTLDNLKPNFWNKLGALIYTEVLHRFRQLSIIGLLPSFVEPILPILTQPYMGDITIIPKPAFSDYIKVVSNPSISFVSSCTTLAERNTWPKVSLIQNMMLVEQCLEKCVRKLRRAISEEGTMNRTRSERNMVQFGGSHKSGAIGHLQSLQVS
eukprot:TRINITY_DN7959_c0_g1_i1.p1 TRINITY_DN7959_c0_g1~~TRINITY_DN7959_c0_g1_i1.p1  ORF type:complete len:575 (+),score=113.28 TRINITY_DN7959_c0_g1_i1:46-1770(+)